MRKKYETMMRFVKKQDPLTQDDFDELLKEHHKFISSGGAGGNWKSWVTDEKKGVVFGQYLGPEGNEGRQMDLSYNNLEKINLKSVSLTYANLVGVLCRNQNLKKIDLTGSLCIDSDFSRTDFEGANLTKVDFSRSNMNRCILRNANLTDTDFENTDLTDADLTGAIVTSGTSFKGTILKDAKKDYKIIKNSSKRKARKSGSMKTRNISGARSKSYKTCPICKDIPDSCYAYWKGGVLESSPLPASEAKLEIVGAPIYDDSTSYSHSIIKRCPECGTCYNWRFEYEYLVNGSEDEITLTRLSKTEAKKRVKKIIQNVRMQYGLLKAKGVSKSELLEKKLSNQELYDVVNYFYHNQLVKDFDISYVVKYLVNALINHTHVKKDCAGNYLLFTLSKFAEKKEKNNEKILNLLMNTTKKMYKPEVEELLKNCKLNRLDSLTNKIKALEKDLKSKKLKAEDYQHINRKIEKLYKEIQDFN
ncbi:MAG: pentapeptide repeat-containing protein [Candidatus Helarchaeota archaeon]